MTLRACIPVIPSADLARSLRFWVDALGFAIESEMRDGAEPILYMLRNGDLQFMLNRRGGKRTTPDGYEGIRLYWAPSDLHATRERLEQLGYAPSTIVARDYGQSEFFLTDDDGHTHTFGVATGP